MVAAPVASEVVVLSKQKENLCRVRNTRTHKKRKSAEEAHCVNRWALRRRTVAWAAPTKEPPPPSDASLSFYCFGNAVVVTTPECSCCLCNDASFV